MDGIAPKSLPPRRTSVLDLVRECGLARLASPERVADVCRRWEIGGDDTGIEAPARPSGVSGVSSASRQLAAPK